ncbi:hypothetical protein [Elioraea sp.]|uniref:hypothetical protein n=1 Tax=Elioraea sp. TaxID=2185103 RepID=UPI0025C5F01D|nr:hypothetical protein [Elioraea sp.]
MIEGPRIPRPSAESERNHQRRAAIFEWLLVACLLILVATVAPIVWRVAERWLA